MLLTFSFPEAQETSSLELQSWAGVTSAMLPLHDCDSLTSGLHPSRLESSSCNLQPADIYSFGEGNAASYRVPCIFYLLMNILKWWVKFKISILDPPVSSPPPGPDHAFPRGLREEDGLVCLLTPYPTFLGSLFLITEGRWKGRDLSFLGCIGHCFLF